MEQTRSEGEWDKWTVSKEMARMEAQRLKEEENKTEKANRRYEEQLTDSLTSYVYFYVIY